jgi:hypothetical protein
MLKYQKAREVSLAKIEVGDGKKVLFWSDRWINGFTAEIAPAITALVPTRRRNSRTVFPATLDNAVADVAGTLTVENCIQCVKLWEQIHRVQRNVQEPDKFIWNGAASGQYSAKDTYAMLCQGSTTYSMFEPVWKSYATPTIKLFCWLALRYRLWTSDRRYRRFAGQLRLLLYMLT